MSEIMARIVERENKEVIKNTRIEVALSLIADGLYSLKKIAEISKLSLTEVEELEKQYRESRLL